MTKVELEAAVAEARTALSAAEDALFTFAAAPENNVFATVDEACSVLEDRLRDQAHEDCEGAGNCGLPTYSQKFIVDGALYLGTLTVEYNRHDKTYYYIDEAEFTHEEIGAA